MPLKSYSPHSPNLADARSPVNNVEHFNTRRSNSIDNQMRVENDIAIHAAFGWNVVAGRVIREYSVSVSTLFA